MNEHNSFAEHDLHVGGLTIHYGEGPPAGPPLVLLHGGSGRWEYMLPIARLLADRFRVLAPDLRGHGRSSWTPGHYRMEDIAGDVAEMIERLVRGPAAVFGHSLGAQVATVLAASRPDLVAALIVGDVPLDRDRLGAHLQGRRAELGAWRALAGSDRPVQDVAADLESLFGRSDPWFQYMAETLKFHDPDFLSAVLDRHEDMNEGYRADLLLPRLICPVLLFQADRSHGGVMTDQDVEEARRHVSRVEVVRIEGTGHVFYVDRADAVVDAIVAFLQTAPA